MKITRNIFIILYAILLVINDPQVARAHTIEGIGISQAGIIENKPVYVDPYEETGQKAYHITYILNGGENSISNREVYHEKELPVTLDVPVKEGSYLGWERKRGMLNQLNQYILQGKNPFRINTIQNQIENQDIEKNKDNEFQNTGKETLKKILDNN